MTKRQPITLAAIWGRAARELTQVTHDWGFRSKKMACAKGAIEYYCGVEERLVPAEGLAKELSTKAETAALREFGSFTGVIALNDIRGWNFADFSSWAARRGI